MFRNLMKGLLAAETTTPAWATAISEAAKGIVGQLLSVILILIAVVGVIYVIILGVNYAKAEDSGKREEAKKRIINACVGMVIMIALLVILYVVMNNMTAIATWITNWSDTGTYKGPTGG